MDAFPYHQPLKTKKLTSYSIEDILKDKDKDEAKPNDDQTNPPPLAAIEPRITRRCHDDLVDDNCACGHSCESKRNHQHPRSLNYSHPYLPITNDRFYRKKDDQPRRSPPIGSVLREQHYQSYMKRRYIESCERGYKTGVKDAKGSFSPTILVKEDQDFPSSMTKDNYCTYTDKEEVLSVGRVTRPFLATHHPDNLKLRFPESR